MRAVTLICLLLVSFTECAFAQDVSDEEAVRAFADQWRAAYAKGDLDGLSDLYEEDAWLLSRDRLPRKGREAILAHFAGMKERGVRADIAFDYESVVIEDDLAVMVAKWWLVAETDGAPPTRDAGRSLVVLKRSAEGWRVWRDMDNHAPDVTVIDGPFAEEAR
jgi:uncharacterized protein (TIGR02246 family)